MIPTCDVGVGLHPHATDRDDLALGHLSFHPVIDRRVVLLGPPPLLGLRTGKNELGVLLAQGGDVGEGAAALQASRIGQSQAESMSACPTAETVCAVRAARCRQYVPQELASRSRVLVEVVQSRQRSRARNISWRRGSLESSCCITPRSTSTSKARPRETSSTTTRSAPPSR